VPSLILDKIVVNNNGGDAAESAWTLFANDGPTPISGPGAAGNTDVQSDASFKTGTYNLSESSGPAGYTAGDWNCAGGSQNGSALTIALGESATCTLTNDDEGAGLTLIKQVINNSGGSSPASTWTLSASGGPTPFSGPGPNISSGEGFQPGSYDLSESDGPENYSASDWVCTGGTQDDTDTITLALGEAAICTITNDDIVTDELIFSNGFESN